MILKIVQGYKISNVIYNHSFLHGLNPPRVKNLSPLPSLSRGIEAIIASSALRIHRAFKSMVATFFGSILQGFKDILQKFSRISLKFQGNFVSEMAIFEDIL